MVVSITPSMYALPPLVDHITSSLISVAEWPIKPSLPMQNLESIYIMALIKGLSGLFHRPFPVPNINALFSKRTLCMMGSGCSDLNYSASLLHRNWRISRCLSVTDLTDSEWCEEQKEFSLNELWSSKKTTAMKTGHYDQVIKKVRKHQFRSPEDAWAIKFMIFIVRANELLVHGSTRELPLVGFIEEAGEWLVGRTDEVLINSHNFSEIVEKKTRRQATLPAEPQRRKGMFQVMIYKMLWDISGEFPMEKFFHDFELNPEHILSPHIIKKTVESSFPCETLRDLIDYFRITCSLLPPAHDQLRLRYELQGNRSLLMESQFPCDPVWVMGKIKYHLEFLRGRRQATYTPMEERWKCNSCPYSSRCTAYSNVNQT